MFDQEHEDEHAQCKEYAESLARDRDAALDRLQLVEQELEEARAKATRFAEQLEQALKPSIDGPGRYIHDSEHKAIVERLQSEVDRLTAQDRAHAGRVVDLMQEIEQFGRASEMYLFSANALRDEITAVRADRDRLDKLVNSPEIEDFLKGVRLESAHQRERWGEAHDRDKSAENWLFLVGHLAGKACRSSIEGNREKALHHCISSAAALFQWHAAILRDTSGCGLGIDADLDPEKRESIIIESTPSGGEPIFAERYAQGAPVLPAERSEQMAKVVIDTVVRDVPPRSA